jgi:hypothetical protein
VIFIHLKPVCFGQTFRDTLGHYFIAPSGVLLVHG